MNAFSIAYQGEPGAYSEEAILTQVDPTAITLPCKDFHSVLKTVEEGKAKYGLLPVENTLTDTIWDAYELLIGSNLKPYREIIHPIHHCLICPPETRKITKVYSHPAALAQCMEYLKRMGYEALPEFDTAGSVKKVKEGLLGKEAAAIASKRAAEIYGMKILAEGIEDNQENYTRFFLLATEDSQPTGNDKTSIIFEVEHKPGRLYKAIEVFAKGKINMTKLQSRRIVGRPWEYRFILDFEGHRKEETIREALEELKEVTIYLKILGSYPKQILK